MNHRTPDAYDEHMAKLAAQRTPVTVRTTRGDERATLVGWAGTGSRTARVVFAGGRTPITVHQRGIILDGPE